MADPDASGPIKKPASDRIGIRNATRSSTSFANLKYKVIL